MWRLSTPRLHVVLALALVSSSAPASVQPPSARSKPGHHSVSIRHSHASGQPAAGTHTDAISAAQDPDGHQINLGRRQRIVAAHTDAISAAQDPDGARAAELQRKVDAAILAGMPATLALSGVYNFSDTSLHLTACEHLSLVGDGAATTTLLFQVNPSCCPLRPHTTPFKEGKSMI